MPRECLIASLKCQLGPTHNLAYLDDKMDRQTFSLSNLVCVYVLINNGVNSLMKEYSCLNPKRCGLFGQLRMRGGAKSAR